MNLYGGKNLITFFESLKEDKYESDYVEFKPKKTPEEKRKELSEKVIKKFETEKMTFGKFKGQPINELPRHYLKWLLTIDAPKKKVNYYNKFNFSDDE